MMLSDTLKGTKVRLSIVGIVGLLAGMFFGAPFATAQRPAAYRAEITCLPSEVTSWDAFARSVGGTLTTRAPAGWHLVAITSFQQPSLPTPCVMMITRRS